MTRPVFLAEALAGASAGATVVLDGDEGRHAATVKRIRVGEQIVLTDGAGTAATGVVTAATKATLEVTLDAIETIAAESPVITVVQAIPKGDRGERAVEMLTEIGVDRIVPWAASRSVAQWRGDRIDKGLAKWRATAREATKQARRSWLPEITEPASTAQVVALIETVDLAVVLHEDADSRLADLDLTGVGSILVVVGPEGGISDEERDAFARARILRLGPSVLRTSTAGVAAVAALMSRTDRWR